MSEGNIGAIETTLLLANQFSNNARTEGRYYAVTGQVRILAGDAHSVKAAVHGTQRYEVIIKLEGSAVPVACTCAAYKEGSFCKHIWAVLVAAQSAGYLKDLHAIPFPQLVRDLFPASELTPPSKPSAPSWRQRLEMVQRVVPNGLVANSDSEVVYFMDLDEILRGDRIVLHHGLRRRLQNGRWGTAQEKRFTSTDVARLGPEDRRLLELVIGYEDPYGYRGYRRWDGCQLNHGQIQTLLPSLCRTGRFFLRKSYVLGAEPLRWDDAGPWEVKLRVAASNDQSIVSGILRRGGESMNLSEPTFLLAAGFLLARGIVASFEFSAGFGWIETLRFQGEIRIPTSELKEFQKTIYNLAQPPEIEWPEGCAPIEIREKPRPCVQIVRSEKAQQLQACAHFDYAGERVKLSDPRRKILSSDGSKVFVRDLNSEQSARQLLRELGFREDTYASYKAQDSVFSLTPKKLSSAVRGLIETGWHVEAERVLYRRPSSYRISVQSGIGWFELEGGVSFEDSEVPFPRLLEAVRKGQDFVVLDDGTHGMIPEEWLSKTEFLLRAGEASGDVLRFKPSQAMLLDALLAAEPKATCDEAFENLRRKLSGFEGIQPASAPPQFRGVLRPYQEDGLGWLLFLRDFKFGGCLADDMGLGKTVQVLALLQAMRGRGPSLVVVPRSLIFNWKAEAGRFAPELRVLDHTGAGRGNGFENADLVLTTYGTLRRDAPVLKDVEFEYVILDEAQAIKNDASATAKAARLLKGRHRLALSGTPIENHLGELWSLLEFLNPGMLGRAAVFQDAEGDASRLAVFSRALRPFVCRRTKGQVAKDLPEKTEQTILCELEPGQRKLYDELKEHYRQALLGCLDEEGLKRSKFQVLEALLRLRQAACHPGLIDQKLRLEPSAKLDLLLEKVRQVLDEGHKALVFSQFTSFLSIVRSRLDAEKIPYEYLDGQTRDREGCVTRFQTNSKVKLFLISLKAGGQGLNLTEAEYVILLDPWWNPAVEAQAIDRTHRIGQTRNVFAYRIVAKDTVEEKVLELQKSKRELADAILNAQGGLLRDLTREDLALLLS